MTTLGRVAEATGSNQHHGRRRLGRAQLASHEGEDGRQQPIMQLSVGPLLPALCTQSCPDFSYIAASADGVPATWRAWLSHVSIIRCTFVHFITSCSLLSQETASRGLV